MKYLKIGGWVKSIVLMYLLLLSLTFSAQTKLPSFFGDHMVLQQNEKVSIWGEDNPNIVITVNGNWGVKEKVTSDENGKWKLAIQTPKAGGPYKLTIQGSQEIILQDILIGEVWLCSGQSNMFMPVKGFRNQPINGSNEAILNSDNNQIRLFNTERNASIEPLGNVEGDWKISEPNVVANFSATAYFFAKKLNSVLNVPVGIIHTSWGASNVESWMDKETLSEFKYINFPDAVPKKEVQKTSTLLYNAMLNPFVGYTIKGVLWYQGESNRRNAEAYKKLFPAMITSWRDKWQQGDFPFYFVQIAPFTSVKFEDVNAAFLRESQLKTMQTTKNTGMVVTMDIGECKNIHPKEKKEIGNRLAYWAFANSYGFSKISFSGPIYKAYEISGSKIRLSFEYAENGLSSFDTELIGFEIAGADKVFYKATSKITKNKKVVVWSEEVKQPVAVRYAFKSCANGTLFNIEGLPASSFRTDDWDE